MIYLLIGIVSVSVLLIILRYTQLRSVYRDFKKDPEHWLIKYWVGESKYIGRSLSFDGEHVTIKNELHGVIEKPLSEVIPLYKVS